MGASADAEFVDDIKMTLSNAKLLLITSASARKGIADSNCIAAATFREKVVAGKITMITSALQADVEYSVDFKNGASLSLESKANVLKSIAGKVGGKVTDIGRGNVKGTSLIWGVSLDPVVYSQYLDARRVN